jgi:tight adherence protein B
MSNSIILLCVVISFVFGVLALWVIRKDRRRKYARQRLIEITTKGATQTPHLSLARKIRQAPKIVVFQLPRTLWAKVDRALETTGNRIGLPHLVFTGATAAIIVMLFVTRVLLINSAIATLLGIATAIAAPALLLRLARSRYQDRFLNAFPDALDLVGRAVKAGLPVNEALGVASQEIVDPVGSELRRSLDQVQIGVPMIDALQQMADRIRVADFHFLVVTLALQQKTGGSLAETLGNLSTIIRERKALRLKAKALTSEARASAAVLAVLPFIVGGLMYLMNRDLGRLLLSDPRGRFMMGFAFVSLIIGLSTMNAIVKRAVR